MERLLLEAISNTRDTSEHVQCRKHGECEKILPFWLRLSGASGNKLLKLHQETMILPYGD